jgi:hypothetical protein
MRWLLFASLAIGFGCGGHDTAVIDASGNGDGNGSATDGAVTDTTGANPSTVTLTLNNRPNNAAMFSFIVAYQDGSGPWTIAPAPVGDTYSFTVNAPVYGVAWTCIATVAGPTSQRQVTAAHFAKVERTSVTMDVPARCTDRNTFVGLSGNVTNTGGGFVLVQYGERAAFAANNGNYAFEVQPGTRDLIVSHLSPTGIGNDFAADASVIQRGVTINAMTTRNIDFSTAVATQSFPVTVGAPVNTRVSTRTTLFTTGTTFASLVNETVPAFETISLDATQMDAGDVYDQSITVGSAGQFATTTNATAAPAALTYAAPTPLGGAIASVPTTNPYPQIKTTWAAYSNTIGYNFVALQTLTQPQCGGGPACTIGWTTYLSPGVTGSSPTYQMPDLSGLTGWNAKLQPITGTQVVGTMQAMTSTAGVTDFPPARPTVGTQRAFVRSDWTVTP